MALNINTIYNTLKGHMQAEYAARGLPDPYDDQDGRRTYGVLAMEAMTMAIAKTEYDVLTSQATVLTISGAPDGEHQGVIQ